MKNGLELIDALCEIRSYLETTEYLMDMFVDGAVEHPDFEEQNKLDHGRMATMKEARRLLDDLIQDPMLKGTAKSWDIWEVVEKSKKVAHADNLAR